jgi:hypothetical protein
MCAKMRMSRNTTDRQHIGAVATLNKTIKKSPPDFDEAQKLPDRDIMDILSTKAPKEHKALMIEQAFNPETFTVEELVEISEHAETKDNICHECEHFFNSHDSSSSDDERHRKKKQKPLKARNYQSNQNRKELSAAKNTGLRAQTIPPIARSSMASKLTRMPGRTRTSRRTKVFQLRVQTQEQVSRTKRPTDGNEAQES